MSIFPKMKAATLDERRRLVMPVECPPNSSVIVQQIDEDTWLVKRARMEHKFKRVIIETTDKLRNDPDWDKVEKSFSDHLWNKLPSPEDA